MEVTPTSEAPPLRAFIYCRISQDRTGAHLGADRQQEDCEALAERNGWQVVETYVDNDISAYSGKRRPAYRQMLDDLEAGAATIVIAWHTDRLHRSPTELEEYIDISERRGVNTHTVQAGIVDLSTPSGRMTARILGAVARHESEHKAERVARARLQAARAGKWGGGIRPFGFEPDGKTHRTEEAEAIRHTVDAILTGSSVISVTKALNHKGLTTTRGNTWTTQDVRDMLFRPRNAGIAVYRGEEIGTGHWDPIVPEPQWRAVVALLKDPSRITTPGNTPRWFGSGIYRCGRGDCTATLYVTQSGGRNHPSYRCRTSHGGGRRADKFDQYVQDTIIERLSRPDAEELLLPGPDEVDVAALQAEATNIRQRLADLSAMFGAGQVDAGQLAEGSRVAHAQLEGITAQLARAATRDPLAGLVGVPNVRKVWEGLELDRRRAVLRALLKVTVRQARPGRMPDGGYFDYSAIEFEWLRGPRRLRLAEGGE